MNCHYCGSRDVELVLDPDGDGIVLNAWFECCRCSAQWSNYKLAEAITLGLKLVIDPNRSQEADRHAST